MEYPKINSLWKRQNWYFDEEKKKDQNYQKGRQSFIEGDYAQPEFSVINKWAVDEKIDGTNIRIFWEWPNQPELFPVPRVQFGGRTSAAQIPCHLLNYLQETFTADKLNEVFPIKIGECIILYGEGYGPKIQAAGGNYRGDPGFILFDVKVGDWWLKREDMREIANRLQISSVPDLGFMSTDEIIQFVKSKPLSRCSRNPQMMEGVVCRSDPLMLTRSGKPVIFKLKCKEFE